MGWRWWASTLRPKKQPPRMVPMAISVTDGVAGLGRRNAGTPFDTASTPERATAPDEKPA
jgi:hypothetical protein